MRFRKNVPAEHREFLQEQLKQYKKEITMSKDELRELEKWVASGRSPYDNGDYIYSENGCPMDFVSAMRFQDEMYEWWTSLSKEERELMEAIFYKEESLRSIGKKEKVSYQAIGKRRDKILEKLRKLLEDKF